MKIKIAVFIIISLVSYSVFSQSINYKINRSTNKISHIDYIFRFSKITSYDVDFREHSDKKHFNLKVAVLLNSNGTGKITLADDKEKISARINSAYERKYSNSDEKYWVFNCTFGDGLSMPLYIDINKYRFWHDQKDNKRLYYWVD